ncbi:hypothetical protein KCU88_g6812, partial [Aureobasidium melanogenum]
MADNGQGSSATLSAVYHSPSDAKTFRINIPSSDFANEHVSDPRAKSTYLAGLRAATKKMQEEVNIFLTEKMEQDKQAAGDAGRTDGSKQKADDELEEENYGEEGVDDES